MQRILVVGNHDNGIYRFRKELLQQLINNKYEVYVATPLGEKINLIKELGCEIIETNIDRLGTNLLNEITLIARYNKIIKDVKPDIVLTFTVKPNIYMGLVCRSKNIPYICNITGLGRAQGGKGVLQFLTNYLYKVALKNVNCIFFQNSSDKKFFEEKGIGINKHKLIPGSGVNLREFVPLDYPQEVKVKFMFIARIMKLKGIDQFLEAAEIIRNKYNDTEFHVVGFCEDSYEKIINEKVNKGIIIYHGLQEDINKMHRFNCCTIHPTYYPEGMSNVLLESAACARPIIASDRSGCKEIVEVGRSGYLCKEKDTNSLVEQIEKFLSLSYQERKEMGLAGRRKVEKEFDKQIIIDKYVEEIEKILDK